MSEHDSEPESDERGDEGLEGLQESHLDSVTGGGGRRQPAMDLQDAQPDTIEKNVDPGDYETKASGGEQDVDSKGDW